MQDQEYINRKFEKLAGEGAHKIGIAIRDIQSQAVLSGSTGGSRTRLRVREALQRGFVEVLHELERVALETRIPANETLTRVGQSLAQDLITKYSVPLFGNPAYT